MAISSTGINLPPMSPHACHASSDASDASNASNASNASDCGSASSVFETRSKRHLQNLNLEMLSEIVRRCDTQSSVNLLQTNRYFKKKLEHHVLSRKLMHQAGRPPDSDSPSIIGQHYLALVAQARSLPDDLKHEVLMCFPEAINASELFSGGQSPRSFGPAKMVFGSLSDAITSLVHPHRKYAALQELGRVLSDQKMQRYCSQVRTNAEAAPSITALKETHHLFANTCRKFLRVDVNGLRDGRFGVYPHQFKLAQRVVPQMSTSVSAASRHAEMLGTIACTLSMLVDQQERIEAWKALLHDQGCGAGDERAALLESLTTATTLLQARGEGEGNPELSCTPSAVMNILFTESMVLGPQNKLKILDIVLGNVLYEMDFDDPDTLRCASISRKFAESIFEPGRPEDIEFQLKMLWYVDDMPQHEKIDALLAQANRFPPSERARLLGSFAKAMGRFISLDSQLDAFSSVLKATESLDDRFAEEPVFELFDNVNELYNLANNEVDYDRIKVCYLNLADRALAMELDPDHALRLRVMTATIGGFSGELEHDQFGQLSDCDQNQALKSYLHVLPALPPDKQLRILDFWYGDLFDTDNVDSDEVSKLLLDTLMDRSSNFPPAVQARMAACSSLAALVFDNPLLTLEHFKKLSVTADSLDPPYGSEAFAELTTNFKRSLEVDLNEWIDELPRSANDRAAMSDLIRLRLEIVRSLPSDRQAECMESMIANVGVLPKALVHLALAGCASYLEQTPGANAPALSLKLRDQAVKSTGESLDTLTKKTSWPGPDRRR